MIDAPPDEEAAPEVARPRRRRLSVPGWGLAAIALAVLAGAILPPAAEVGLVALLDEPGPDLDPIVTGTATAPGRRYTVRRSVLHPAGETCTVFVNGLTRGAC